jgi:tetratricopeptide (TPR) repeat protein
VLAAFLAGLLCKTTLVTLPALLLLLDTWPLRRCAFDAPDRRAALTRLVVEKLPLFLLASAASAVAVYAQKAGVIAYDDFPLASRVQNAVLSYFAYAAQTIVPAGLSPFYPFLESSLELWRVIPAALGLAGITVWAIAWHRRAPYFLVGWLWYLGVLVPMIGLVQVGAFARADRFTYLPQIGLLLALTWGACELTRRWKFRAALLAAASAIVLAACAAITVRQIGFWSESETLFRHALAVTNDNGVARECLASALLEKRKSGVVVPQAVSAERGAEAIAHLREAARLLPGHAHVHLNLGIALFATKNKEEAAAHLRIALETMTFHANGHFLLGLLLLDKGELDEGMRHLEKSLDLDSHNAVARINLASIYRRQGRLGDAIAQYRAAIRQDPDYSDAHNNLGIALHQAGFRDEAVREFREAVRCDPENASARRNLDAASH